MNRYVAFAREINVGGRAIVKMQDLKRAFAAAGCDSVQSCIQSGNVVFGATGTPLSSLMRKLEPKLVKLVGAEIAVAYRSLHELEELIRLDPFRDAQTRPGDKRYVSFLTRKPTAQPRLPLYSEKQALKVLHMRGLDVFVISGKRPSGWYGFPNNFVEKELGVCATTRNWSTLLRIVREYGTGTVGRSC